MFSPGAVPAAFSSLTLAVTAARRVLEGLGVPPRAGRGQTALVAEEGVGSVAEGAAAGLRGEMRRESS